MDQFFIRFKEAYLAGNGNRLSEILLPLFASKHRSIIHRFYNASNASSVKADIQYNIFNGPLSVLRLSTEEGKAWVDIFVAYWTATGELISAEHIEQAQQVKSPLLLASILPFFSLPIGTQSFISNQAYDTHFDVIIIYCIT
jgi:hypothetical protein